MISKEYMMELLDEWAKWVKSYKDEGLGYPKRSVGISSGSSQYGAFEAMCDHADEHQMKIVNTGVYDLAPEEQSAIFWRYFKQKPKPMYYEFKLQMAMEHLYKKIAEKLV